MKKLIMAVVIVCTAAYVQSATFTWSCSKVYKEGTETGVSGSYYIIGAIQPIGEEGANVTLTSALIISALEGQGATAVNEWLDGLTAVKATGSNGTFSNTATANAKDISDANFTGGQKNNVFAIIFDSAEITDASKFYIASKSDQNIGNNGNTVVSFGTQGNSSLSGKSQVAGAWHAVAAPEPTSGLLLLLGVAGMALRRRRV